MIECRCPDGYPQVKERRVKGYWEVWDFGNFGLLELVHTGECPRTDEFLKYLLPKDHEND